MIESNTVIIRDEDCGFEYKLEQDHFGVSINWKSVGDNLYDADENGIFVSKDELKNFISVLQKMQENY
jgi:hypothetical protein